MAVSTFNRRIARCLTPQRFIGTYCLCPTSINQTHHAKVDTVLTNQGVPELYHSTKDRVKIPLHRILAIICLTAVTKSAVDVSSTTELSLVNVVRNNWHLQVLITCDWPRLLHHQIRSSVWEHSTNLLAMRFACYQIDTRLPWIPAKEHRTGHLHLSRLGVMYT